MEDSYEQQLNHSNLSQSDAKSSLATPPPPQPPQSLPDTRCFALHLDRAAACSTELQSCAQVRQPRFHLGSQSSGSLGSRVFTLGQRSFSLSLNHIFCQTPLPFDSAEVTISPVHGQCRWRGQGGSRSFCTPLTAVPWHVLVAGLLNQRMHDLPLKAAVEKQLHWALPVPSPRDIGPGPAWPTQGL